MSLPFKLRPETVEYIVKRMPELIYPTKPAWIIGFEQLSKLLPRNADVVKKPRYQRIIKIIPGSIRYDLPVFLGCKRVDNFYVCSWKARIRFTSIAYVERTPHQIERNITRYRYAIIRFEPKLAEREGFTVIPIGPGIYKVPLVERGRILPDLLLQSTREMKGAPYFRFLVPEEVEDEIEILIRVAIPVEHYAKLLYFKKMRLYKYLYDFLLPMSGVLTEKQLADIVKVTPETLRKHLQLMRQQGYPVYTGKLIPIFRSRTVVASKKEKVKPAKTILEFLK